VRVLPGLYNERPISFDALVEETELYFLFMPVKGAVRKKLVEIVAYEMPIPERVMPFPLMRWAGLPDVEWRPSYWVLWNGTEPEQGRVRTLTPEQRALSIFEFADYQIVVERLGSPLAAQH